MMAVCLFWLLTYIGQGLDLAVGNRPVIIMQEQQDYRSGIRKKSELANNMLLKIYPSETSQRDEFSNWVLMNEEPRISSWNPTGILIEDMIREPRDLQTVFFTLSPTTLNTLYSEYANTGSHQEQFLQDDQQAVGGPLRGKKFRVDCRHPTNTVRLPMTVCDDDTGHKSLETRQSNYETNFKTDPSSRGHEKPPRDYQNGAAFVSRPPFGLDAAKPPGKRNYMPVGRRAVDLPGDASPPHQAQQPPPSPPPPSSLGNGVTVTSLPRMLRSPRGGLQYDVPQIECPISDDGMERFACPVADRLGRYHCIDDHALCDGFIDCPSGEDEDRQACMFYKTTKAHLDVLADAILRWARGR